MTEDHSGSGTRDLATVLAERRVGLTWWTIWFAVMLGILIVFAGIVVISTLRVQAAVDEGGSAST